MRLATVVKRFLVPGLIVTAIYWIKYRCMVSPRAEVELTKNLRIGRGTHIGSFVKIKASTGPLTIGRQGSIGSGCFISAEKAGIQIGDHCLIGPNTSIIGNDYEYARLDIPIAQQAKTSKGIRIGHDVWIGAGCAIADGVDIGDHCIVAPNSLVTQSLAAKTVAMGSPAKRVFERR
jgi:acetyltransferase-like isoleucine patch superfamily enzyme